MPKIPCNSMGCPREAVPPFALCGPCRQEGLAAVAAMNARHRAQVADDGDRWHVTYDCDDGRRFEVWMPKSANTVDLVNFGQHLRELADRIDRETQPQ